MPRLQVYLPDVLAKELKRRKLSPSALLQDALRAEIARRESLAKLEEYLVELVEEVGEPGRAERARSDALARRISRRAARKAS